MLLESKKQQHENFVEQTNARMMRLTFKECTHWTTCYRMELYQNGCHTVIVGVFGGLTRVRISRCYHPQM